MKLLPPSSLDVFGIFHPSSALYPGYSKEKGSEATSTAKISVAIQGVSPVAAVSNLSDIE